YLFNRYNEGERSYLQAAHNAGINVTDKMIEKIENLDKRRNYFKEYKKTKKAKKRRFELKKGKKKISTSKFYTNFTYKGSFEDNPNHSRKRKQEKSKND